MKYFCNVPDRDIVTRSKSNLLKNKQQLIEWGKSFVLLSLELYVFHTNLIIYVAKTGESEASDMA